MRTFDPGPAVDRYAPRVLPPWERPMATPRVRRVPVVHIVLFVLTFITTSMAGAIYVGVDLWDLLLDPASIRKGFPFSVTMLTILLVHELGHYFLSKVHGVRATLPYFIPAPPIFPIGTFGAFIRMKSTPPNRRALFDIGAAGPWAGLFVAIPAIIIGLRLSEVRPVGLDDGGWILGDSLLFSFLTRLTLGANPNDVTIVLHPIAWAGWFGLLVTCLNLLPIGQLDGGHVVYALFGRWHRLVSRGFLVVIMVLGFYGWMGWFVWVVLLLFIGVDHPPTHDAVTPLDWRRRLAAWLTLAAFAVTFIPEPFKLAPPSPAFDGARTPVAWRVEQLPQLRDDLRAPVRRKPMVRGARL